MPMSKIVFDIDIGLKVKLEQKLLKETIRQKRKDKITIKECCTNLIEEYVNKKK